MIPEPAATEKKHFMGYPHHISLVTSDSGHGIYYNYDSITKMVKSQFYSIIRGLSFVVLNSLAKNQKCLDTFVSRLTYISLLDC